MVCDLKVWLWGLSLPFATTNDWERGTLKCPADEGLDKTLPFVLVTWEVHCKAENWKEVTTFLLNFDSQAVVTTKHHRCFLPASTTHKPVKGISLSGRSSPSYLRPASIHLSHSNANVIISTYRA